MSRELEITLKWDEVAGEYAGHIVGLPEATIHGGRQIEEFIAAAREMTGRFHLEGRPVIFTDERHRKLNLGA